MSGVDWGVIFWIAVGLYTILSALGLVLLDGPLQPVSLAVALFPRTLMRFQDASLGRHGWLTDRPREQRRSRGLSLHLAVWSAGRLRRWCHRNGIARPRPGWPGIVHQFWGWYDGLSSLSATVATVAGIVLLAATSLYLATASAAVRGLGEAQAAASRTAAVANVSAVVASAPAPIPTAIGESRLRSVTTLPTSLRLREKPSTTVATLRELPAGTRLDVLDGTATTNGFLWIRVRMLDGTLGWVIDDGVE